MNKIGDKFEVSDEESYHRYPTGIDGRTRTSKDTFCSNANYLLELSKDTITKIGNGTLVCEVMKRRKMKAKISKGGTLAFLMTEWARMGVEEVMKMYTDGSYKEEANWGEFLLGTPRNTAGGAIILSD